MKILFATPYFHPRIGGLELYAQAVALEMVARGHEVHVVTSGDGAATEDWRGLTIHRLRPWMTVSNTPVNPLWWWQLRRLMRQLQPDVLNVHAPVPTMALAAAASAGRVPMVVTYHAGSMKKGRPGIDLLISIYERLLLPRLLKRAGAIICASDFVRDGFLGKWKTKSTTVTPGVDTERFTPAAYPKEQQVLFVGDFRDPRKGLDILNAAMKEVPGVRLRVVGAGEPRKQNGVSYAGVLQGDALVRELQGASILVLPSTTEAESFGMVLIEAMACARPVIGSRIGGIHYVIDDGRDGILVPPKDVAALARAIKSLASDPKRGEEMGRTGRRKAEQQFTWTVRGQQTEQIFKEVIRG